MPRDFHLELLGAVVLLSAACTSAPRDIEVPTGRSTPLADYAAIWEAASTRCRSVHTMDLMVVFGGRAGETRIRRTRARTAIARPGSLRLEGLAPLSAPGFIFVARPGEATLLLPRARQVVRGASAPDLLYTLAGLALDPDDVRALLTGCVVPEGVAVSARAYGDQWVAIDLDGGATVYARQVGGDRVISIGTRGDLIVEYAEHVRGLPRQAHIQTRTATSRTDVTVALSQVNINTTLDPDVFAVSVPDTFAPITLDEWRRGSPTEDRTPPTDGCC